MIRHSRVRLASVALDDRLAGASGYDSLAFVKLVVHLEDALGIDIDPAEFSGLREMTVRDLLGIVERAVAARVSESANP